MRTRGSTHTCQHTTRKHHHRVHDNPDAQPATGRQLRERAENVRRPKRDVHGHDSNDQQNHDRAEADGGKMQVAQDFGKAPGFDAADVGGGT